MAVVPEPRPPGIVSGDVERVVSTGEQRIAIEDLENIVLRMSRRFGVGESVVRTYANEVAATFSEARIPSFVPILIEREVRDLLRHAGLGRRELGGDPSHGP